MRWRVQINDITGDVLAETLAAVNFDLDGDMLSGESFEALDNWGDVSDAAHDLARRVREIGRLNAGVEIGFCSGAVHEYDTDGGKIGVHNKIFVQGAALTLAATAVGVITVSSSLSPEERAEIARQERAAKAGELIRAVMACELVLTVLPLLDGEPGTLQLGHVHDLIQDDMNGDLSRFAPEPQLTRFNRSINHPDVLGLDARHAVTNVEPPPNPMDIGEATQFITAITEKWIKAKANN